MGSCLSGVLNQKTFCRREHLPETFVALDAEVALAAGLYGATERMHPETPRRLGDVVLIAQGNTCWWDKHNDQVLLGQHEGLEPEEMLVPFVALRLEPSYPNVDDRGLAGR
jgi:hypothetical protein